MWISKGDYLDLLDKYDRLSDRAFEQEQTLKGLMYHMGLKEWKDSEMFLPKMVTLDEYKSLIAELNKQGAYKHPSW